MPVIPPLGSLVLYALGSLSAALLVWYLRRSLIPWIQAYRDRQAAIDAERVKIAVQAEDQKANAESDALKKIEGR